MFINGIAIFLSLHNRRMVAEQNSRGQPNLTFGSPSLLLSVDEDQVLFGSFYLYRQLLVDASCEQLF